MKSNELLASAALIALLSFPAAAQQTSIADLPAPITGSTSLSYGDIIPATRGGTPGLGGGTTYGLLAGWGGVCTTGEYVSSINAQGVPSCGYSQISNGTTFTIASGCATATSLVGGIFTGQFVTGGTTCSPVVTLPAAPTGYWCSAWDITTTSVTFKETAKSTTSCTLTASTSTGASDVIVIHFEGY